MVWFIPAPAGFLIVSLVMEILVLCNALSVGHVIIGTVVFSTAAIACLGWKCRHGLSPIRHRLSGSGWLIFPVFFLILYLYNTVYPFDFIYDTTDCGAYVTSGIQAFKSGSYTFIDPDIPGSDDAFRTAFYQVTPPDKFTSARKFRFEGMMGAGYFIRSMTTGRIDPRYFNLHPLWIGLFVGMIGLVPGVWLATPFLAFCGISGLFMLARALGGRLTAVLTIGLASVFVLQVWFGRYITTEMAVQASILNSLAWLLIFRRPDSSDVLPGSAQPAEKSAADDDPRFAFAISGMMLALGHFARIDTVLITVAVGVTAVLWIGFLKELSQCAWFLWAYLLVASGALLTALYMNESYVLETFTHVDVKTQPGRLAVVGIVACLTMMALAFQFRAKSDRVVTWFVARRGRFVNLLVLIITLAAIYGYFVRPMMNPPDYDAFNALSKETRSKAFPAMTMRWLGWYLTPLGLFAAIAGVCLLLKKKLSLHNALFFIIAGIYCFYYTKSLHCTPFHYWGMRRFITMVIPVLLIGLGFLFREAFAMCHRRCSRLAAGFLLLLFAAIAGCFIHDLQYIHRFNHWKGAIGTLERIDAILPENSRLLMPTYPGIYMYTPLKLIFGRKVYLTQKTADQDYVMDTIRSWLSKNERVFVMSTTPVEETAIEGFQLIPVMNDNPHFPRLEDFVDRKPDRRGTHAFSYFIVEVEAGVIPVHHAE